MIKVGDRVRATQVISYDEGGEIARGYEGEVIEQVTGDGRWLVRWDDALIGAVDEEQIWPLKQDAGERSLPASPLTAILDAWLLSGDRPAELHADAQQRLRITWPALAGALDTAAGLDAEALRADAMRAAGAAVPGQGLRREHARAMTPPVSQPATERRPRRTGPWDAAPGGVQEERNGS